MQAQTELGTPENLDVKEKTLKSEDTKNSASASHLMLKKHCELSPSPLP